MAASKSLRRLLRVREIEEERRRTELEGAVRLVQQMRHLAASIVERERNARQLTILSANNDGALDRWRRTEESNITAPLVKRLNEMIAQVEDRASALRQVYLDKRIERMQVETLMQKNEAIERSESERREQQALDDWRALSKARHEKQP